MKKSGDRSNGEKRKWAIAIFAVVMENCHMNIFHQKIHLTVIKQVITMFCSLLPIEAVLYKTDIGIKTMLVSDLSAYPFGFILNLTPEHPTEYGVSIMCFFEAEYDKEYNMQWRLIYLERTSETLPMPLQFKPLPKNCKGAEI